MVMASPLPAAPYPPGVVGGCLRNVNVYKPENVAVSTLFSVKNPLIKKMTFQHLDLKQPK